MLPTEYGKRSIDGATGSAEHAIKRAMATQTVNQMVFRNDKSMILSSRVIFANAYKRQLFAPSGGKLPDSPRISSSLLRWWLGPPVSTFLA